MVGVIKKRTYPMQTNPSHGSDQIDAEIYGHVDRDSLCTDDMGHNPILKTVDPNGYRSTRKSIDAHTILYL